MEILEYGEIIMGEDLNQMHQKDSDLIRKPSKPLLKAGWPLYIFKNLNLEKPSIRPSTQETNV